ncbi:MAG: NADH-quinone oxidoreductase subunit N [SAR324 cluster bacterium]|nr:NADH-quinone oxidoreductase subunit N [SAR324 cluster bacterium]
MTFVTISDFIPIVPELILVLTALLVLLVDLVGTQTGYKMTSPLLAIGGLCVAVFAEIQLFGGNRVGFFDTIVADQYSILFEIIYMVTGIITITISWHYIAENNMNFREYYVLMLFSIVGMMLMTSSLDLLMIFIGLEIMSISSYIMVGMMRRVVTANEAALKYLLLGAFSTGFLLYGISLIYGATGSTQLPAIIEHLQQAGAFENPLVGFGLALLIIGVGFKVAIVPFHMWTPDVYTGAPTPVAAFMSAAVKAAGFAILIRIFLTGIPHAERWDNMMWVIAILTMTVGNVMALRQNNIKRMLAYSSIAHAGYVMVAVVVGSEAAITSIIYYSFAYALMGMGAFGVLSIRSNGKTIETYEDLAGYAHAGPTEQVAAVLMSTFMLSLLGLPLTAGFIGKFQIFYAALDEGWFWLTVIAAMNSVISLFYYLRVIVFMYMKERIGAQQEKESQTSVSSLFAITGLLATAAGIVYLGIFPNDFVQLAQLSVTAISF